MSTRKLIVRIGAAATIPVLEVGEPGWDTDVKTARFGDGTSTPPRIMTDKSSGKFEYLNVDYVTFKEIRITQGGKIDGVTLNLLNKNNGIVVRTGDNLFSQKSIVGQDGYTTISNGDGSAEGNITVKLNADLVTKLDKIKIIEVGPTSGRPTISNLGDFRYNTDIGLFEGFVDSPTKAAADRRWRSLPTISDQAIIFDFGVHFNTIADFKSWVKNRVVSNKVSLRFPVGKTQFNDETWNFDDCLTKNIELLGQDPVDLPLGPTPVNSVTGSSNSWNVTYQLTQQIPADVNVGSYVIVDVPVFGGLTGSNSSYGTNEDSNTLSTRTTLSRFVDPGIGNLDISKSWLLANCFNINTLTTGVYARKIQAVSQTTASLLSAFPMNAAYSNFVMAEELSNTTANSTTNNSTIQTVGVDPSKVIEPEDIIFLTVPANAATKVQMYRVQSVSPTGVTIYGKPSSSLSGATMLYIKTGIMLHTGCWRVSGVDRLNNRITLENKVYNQAPSTYNVKNIKLSWIPSVIERTNTNVHLTGYSSGTTVSITNLAFNSGVAYSSYCCDFRHGKIVFDGKVGFTRWKKAARFSLSDVVGSGKESIAISDIVNPNALAVSNDDSAACFDLRNSRGQLYRIFCTGNANAPLLCRSSAAVSFASLITAGNAGYAQYFFEANIDINNLYSMFNGPSNPDFIVGGLANINVNYFNVFSKTLGAGPDLTPNFCGPLTCYGSQVNFTSGILSALNSSIAVSAGSSATANFGDTIFHGYASGNNSALYTFTSGRLSGAYNAMFWQGPRIWTLVTTSRQENNFMFIDAIVSAAVGYADNASTFQAGFVIVPQNPASISQNFDLYNFSRASYGASNGITFTNNSGSSSYGGT